MKLKFYKILDSKSLKNGCAYLYISITAKTHVRTRRKRGEGTGVIE